MATINLYLSDKVDEFGKSELYVRFSGSREFRFRAKTGFFIPINRWTKRNELSIPKIETPERVMLLNLSDDIERLKKHIIKSFEAADKDKIGKNWLIDCIDKFRFPEKYQISDSDFFSVFELYLKKTKASQGRERGLKVVYRIVKRFELYNKKHNPNFKLTFDSFNKESLSLLEDYIRNEKKYLEKHKDIIEAVKESRPPEQRGQNTINSKLIMLRTFLHWCVENDIIQANPFAKYRIDATVYGTPYYITIEERNIIYNHDFSSNPSLAIQRDIFVFQCLVGCRVGDLYSLKKSNVIGGAIEYIARKTQDGNPVTVRVPLNAQAKEILERYKDFDKGPLLPFIASQNYNYAIKKIFEQAGITRPVTVLNPKTRRQEQVPINEIASSHLARRTFIGNLYKQVKDPNLVGSLSGHKEGSRAFSRYRDIDDEMKKDLVNLLL